MAKVEYDKFNLFKCKCTVCPVQEDSQMAKIEMSRVLPDDCLENVDDEYVKNLADWLIPEPSRSPAVYCADTVCGASHLDLNFNQDCLCASCEIKNHHSLAGCFYCMNGSLR